MRTLREDGRVPTVRTQRRTGLFRLRDERPRGSEARFRATRFGNGEYLMDGFSRVHFKTVQAEIEGRFFSKEEADQLKEAIDRQTITDAQTRALAAKAWET
jgi:hypothetical protein